jgi:hypothetical protein
MSSLNKAVWMKSGFVFLLLMVLIVSGSAQESAGCPPVAKSADAQNTFDFIKWLDALTKKASLAARPGMTRGELLKTFAEEGGLSTRKHRQYVLKECRTIKVAVDFAPVGPANKFGESLDDKIVTVSAPFLQVAIFD